MHPILKMPKGDYVYVSRPNRVATPEWESVAESILAPLFGDAVLVCPRYSSLSWDWNTHGPRCIKGATWFVAWVPSDGIVGRGVVEETRIALEKHREVTVVFQGKPHNFCESPFEVIDEDDWVLHARLKGIRHAE